MTECIGIPWAGAGVGGLQEICSIWPTLLSACSGGRHCAETLPSPGALKGCTYDEGTSSGDIRGHSLLLWPRADAHRVLATEQEHNNQGRELGTGGRCDK